MDATVAAKVQVVIDHAQQVIQDDALTVSEASRLTMHVIQRGVIAARRLSIPGHEKRQMVLDGVKMLYDLLIPALPLPIPRFLRKLVRPFVRSFVLQAAEGAIEAVYQCLYARDPRDSR